MYYRTIIDGQEVELCVDSPEGMTFPEWPMACLWRKYRDGRITSEVLPLWLAEWELSVIPQREPDVERARLVR